jgi:hypothetical protein
MRVFIAPLEVSGFYGALDRGLRELGVDSTFAELWPHRYAYQGELRDVPWPIRATRAIARRHQRTPRGSVRWLAWAAIGGVLRITVFVWAAARFDVFVFGFGSTILEMPGLELRVLRALRRRIIFHFHGSDSRPPYLDGYLSAKKSDGAAELVARAVAVKRRVAIIDKLAHIIVDNPLSAHFHVRTCVNGFAIGVPTVEPSAAASPRAHGTIRILHAPSHPEAKGTPRIREAIARLQARGVALDYIEIVGQTNERVREELRACDFVIDQAYSDTPMAGFAAEAARAGKPALVAGYAGIEFKRWIPDNITPPTYYCHPSELEDGIERLATDAAFREALAQKALAFMEWRSRPSAVAARYLRLIRGDAPQDWYFEPAHISYVHGCGLSEDAARLRLRNILRTYGVGALQLHDKPALEASIVAFADVEHSRSAD